MRDGTKALLCVFLGFASGGCPTIGIVITQFLTYFNYRHNNFSFFPLRAESSSPTWEERAERNQPDPPLFFPLLVMMDEHIRHQWWRYMGPTSRHCSLCHSRWKIRNFFYACAHTHIYLYVYVCVSWSLQSLLCKLTFPSVDINQKHNLSCIFIIQPS